MNGAALAEALQTPAARVAGGVGLCAAVGALLWWFFGPVGLVFTAPLAGALLARPLIDLAADLARHTRRAALGATEGQYYAFKGRPLRVSEDEEGWRWLPTADLRRVLPGLPADPVLERQLGAAVRPLARAGLAVEAEALHGALAAAQDPQTVRFRQWLQRDVILPAQRVRERRRAEGPAPTIPE